MMSMYVCSACGNDCPAGPTLAHWNQFVAAHLDCDSAPQHPDRMTAHEEAIGRSQERAILIGGPIVAISVFTAMVWALDAFNWAELGILWLALNAAAAIIFSLKPRAS